MSCSDSSAGSEAAPFCSIMKGVQACRAASDLCAVFLRGGVHRLKEPILLGPSDSNLTIAGYEQIPRLALPCTLPRSIIAG